MNPSSKRISKTSLFWKMWRFVPAKTENTQWNTEALCGKKSLISKKKTTKRKPNIKWECVTNIRMKQKLNFQHFKLFVSSFFISHFINKKKLNKISINLLKIVIHFHHSFLYKKSMERRSVKVQHAYAISTHHLYYLNRIFLAFMLRCALKILL